MNKIVMSQPMFFPWIGLFEQIRLANFYVHYDAVQLTRDFVRRVQIKTQTGSIWLGVPLKHSSDLIRDTLVDESQPWRKKHLKTLESSYARAPFFSEMIDIVKSIYSLETSSLSEINRFAIESISTYFGLETQFLYTSDFSTGYSSSERILKVVQSLNGTTYITGHGARNYLEHELFERNGVSVEYMNYLKKPYPQLHGDFNPYVSVLDLIANLGRNGVMYISSGTTHWKEFLNEPA